MIGCWSSNLASVLYLNLSQFHMTWGETAGLRKTSIINQNGLAYSLTGQWRGAADGLNEGVRLSDLHFT